jgi:Ca-activated chloride channel homolog
VSFQTPLLLLLLVAIPAAAAVWVWLDRRRARSAEVWGTPALLSNLQPDQPSRRRYVPLALFLLGLAFLVVGFARPQAVFETRREGATVVLVMDVSASMEATDVKPSRLRAARTAATAFVDGLPTKYRVGVVTFADHVSVPAAPTFDRDRVKRVLAFAPAGEGTALARAVTRSVDVARRAVGRVSENRSHPPAAILLISDGAQTQGRATPQQAGLYARKRGIPVSTIAIGTRGGIVERKLRGGYTERIQVPADATALKTIAAASEGTFFRAATPTALKKVYSELGSRLSHTRKRHEVTPAAAGAALAFMLAGAAFSGFWFRRIV